MIVISGAFIGKYLFKVLSCYGPYCNKTSPAMSAEMNDEDRVFTSAKRVAILPKPPPHRMKGWD
jgi:hypothetical protein